MKLFNRSTLDKLKNKQLFIWITLIAYASITLLVLLRHEPWRDEAQAWLISRDLSISGIINQMKYEGHPALWSLLLVPFAKLHFPYIMLNIISWIITCFASWILLTFAPFNRITKISILSGSAFLYSFPILSRNYALIPLLIFAIAAMYPKQKERPIIYGILLALLANTNVIMLGFTGILIFIYFKDNIYLTWKSLIKKQRYENIVALALMIFGMLAVYLQLSNSLNSNAVIKFNGAFFIFQIPDVFMSITKSIFGHFFL